MNDDVQHLRLQQLMWSVSAAVRGFALLQLADSTGVNLLTSANSPIVSHSLSVCLSVCVLVSLYLSVSGSVSCLIGRLIG